MSAALEPFAMKAKDEGWSSGLRAPDRPAWSDAFSKTTNDSDEASIKGRIAALVTYLESIQERPAQ